MEAVITCPQCESQNTNKLYQNPSSLYVYSCRNCHHTFFAPAEKQPTIKEQIKALKNPPVINEGCGSDELPELTNSRHGKTKLPTCPTCNSGNTKANHGPSNGVLGPGYFPGAILNYTCNDCGIVFEPVKSQQ